MARSPACGLLVHHRHEHVGDVIVAHRVGVDAGEVEPGVGARPAVAGGRRVVGVEAVAAEVVKPVGGSGVLELKDHWS